MSLQARSTVSSKEGQNVLFEQELPFYWMSASISGQILHQKHLTAPGYSKVQGRTKLDFCKIFCDTAEADKISNFREEIQKWCESKYLGHEKKLRHWSHVAYEQALFSTLPPATRHSRMELAWSLLTGSMPFYLDENENHAMTNFEVGALLHTHTLTDSLSGSGRSQGE